jgi:hypothetical protein
MKLLSALLTLSFSLQLFAINDIEKIIGKDDLVAVNAEGSNIPTRYQKSIDAFGLISMGCTATHIGNGYVLTAGHCFEADESLVKDKGCADVTVDWGVREGKPAYLTSKCESIVAMQRDDVNDFAIFKVSPIPPTAIAVDLKVKISQGFRVTIFSHPEEMPLRWSKYCTVQRKLDPDFSPDTLQHKCDTNPGSSGATIIDAFTGKVVGIHDGGHLTSANDGMNYGTYLTNPVVADILKGLGF